MVLQTLLCCSGEVNGDSMIRQLTLGVHLSDHATFANYYAGDNLAAVATLEQLATKESSEQFIYLWGEQSVGRTHLLQEIGRASCRERV